MRLSGRRRRPLGRVIGRMSLLREERGPKECLTTRLTIYVKCYQAMISREAQIECQKRAAEPLQSEKLTKPREHKRIIRDDNGVPPVGLPSIAKHALELRQERLLASALPCRQHSEVTGDRKRRRT